MTKVLDEQLAVVIPLYNKERSIARAIESVLEQTVNFKELIIVNDGSTDNSLAVAKQFNDERIVVIDQANQGVCAARNNGAKVANADYVCFLDADDAWEPHFLEEIASLIALNPDAGIYCARYAEFDEEGNKFIGNLVNISSDFCGQLADFFTAYKYNRSLICSSNTCIKKSYLNQIGGFPRGVKIGEDIYVWLQIALLSPVMFSAKLSSIIYRNAENRSHLLVKLHTPYHVQYFLDEKQRMVLTATPSLRAFILYNATVFGLYASQTGNRILAVNIAKLIGRESIPHGVIVFIGTCLPKCAIRLLKKWRNKKTLSYE